MVLLTHIVIALASILCTTLAFITPSKLRLQASYVFVTLTLVSGTYLVVATKAPLLRACTMGLIYTGVSLYGIIAARTKLAKQI